MVTILPFDCADCRSGQGQTLISDETHRFMSIVTRDANVIYAQQQINDLRDDWTTHSLVAATAEYNALKLPSYPDDHCWFWNEYDSQGRIHSFGNMHGGNQDPAHAGGDAGKLGYIRMSSPHDLTSFIPGTIDTTGLLRPDELSYPHVLRLSDHTLILVLRCGISGDGDWWSWRLDPGADTWVNQGQIFSGQDLLPDPLSMYPDFYVDPNDRIHVAGVWRNNQTVLDGECFWPWYAYSDDGLLSWYDVSNNPIPMPQSPYNAQGRTGVQAPGGTTADGGWQNGTGILTDINGRPQFTVTYINAGSANRLLSWTGSAWTNTNSFNANMVTQSVRRLLLFDDDRWVYSGSTYRNATNTEARVLAMRNLETNQIVRFAQGMPQWDDGGGNQFYPARWNSSRHDSYALLNRGVVQIALPTGPNGATPRFFSYGDGPTDIIQT